MMKKVSSLSDKLFNAANVTLFILFMILCIYPFYYVAIYSLSNPQLSQKGITLYPVGLTFYNFSKVLAMKDIYSSLMISVIRTITGTILTVFCCSLFAFILTKNELYLRKIIYRFLIITMYLNAGLIPYYLTIKAYGLRNHFLVYIIPGAISAFYIILIKTFIEQLPSSLEESARIDGAGYFTIFRKIIVPLLKPILATVVVFSAVGNWNAWFDTYIFVSNKKLFTLQFVLLGFLQEASRLAESMKNTVTTSSMGSIENQIQITSQSARMTITAIVIVPIMLVYPFMQRYFIKGIMLGAIKG